MKIFIEIIMNSIAFVLIAVLVKSCGGSIDSAKTTIIICAIVLFRLLDFIWNRFGYKQ